MWQYPSSLTMSQQLSQRWAGWPDWKFSAAPRVLMLGSCFSVEMAQRCLLEGWQVMSNPMGTLFHPLVIADWLEQLVDADVHFTQADIVFDQGTWKNLKSGAIGNSSHSEEEVVQWNAKVISEMTTFLQSAELVTITWGTAMGWNYLPENRWVGNCQKLPQQLFKREWISLETIAQRYLTLLPRIQQKFPQLKWVFTVSPVRHEKMGVLENARSKAILLEACYRVTEQTDARYFPSYEWVTDELRDYGYYEKDGCHPNAQAIDFVAKHWIKSFDYE
jgi:hypothetical protein